MFLKTGKITHYIPLINNYYKIICYHNRTGKLVNSECCNRFIKDNGLESTRVTFKYDSEEETYNISVGVAVIATRNVKSKENDNHVFNTMEFTVKDTTDGLLLMQQRQPVQSHGILT